MKKNKVKKISPIKKAFVWLLGNEKWQGITIPLFAIVLSLAAACVVILLVGKNPIDALVSLLQGSGIVSKTAYAAKRNIFTDFSSMLNYLTPMIFAALAVAVAFKAGLFNIGVSGQMLVSGFMATVLVGYSELPAFVAKPTVLIIGIIMGALAGAIIGFLKYRFNINEVVSSIMLNYIFQFVISFFINTYFMNPVSRQSFYVSDAARLTLADCEIMGIKMDIPLAFILTIPIAFLVKFMLDKTRLGYEIKTVGLNQKAAKFAGINVGKNIVTAMVLSGALAGLAGVTFYLGTFSSIQPKVLSTVGFDAIAVSLLGNSNPIGILFSSLLITVVSKGSTYMSSKVGLAQEIAQVVTGLILLFSACGAFIRYKVAHNKDALLEEKLAILNTESKKNIDSDLDADSDENIEKIGNINDEENSLAEKNIENQMDASIKEEK